VAELIAERYNSQLFRLYLVRLLLVSQNDHSYSASGLAKENCMKSNPWAIAALLVVLLLGIALGQHWDNRAMAQAPEAGNILRYQISAYAGPSDGGVHHGCYLVDTRTGQVWHTAAGVGRRDVSPAVQ
jgi:hypothetical protein